MALTKSVEKIVSGFDSKLIASNAYWRIDKLEGNKTLMTALANAYKDADSNVIIDSFLFSFVVQIEGRNFIAQAYDHLKTQPEFAGATDC
jgi:hypothetical protein